MNPSNPPAFPQQRDSMREHCLTCHVLAGRQAHEDLFQVCEQLAQAQYRLRSDAAAPLLAMLQIEYLELLRQAGELQGAGLPSNAEIAGLTTRIRRLGGTLAGLLLPDDQTHAIGAS